MSCEPRPFQSKDDLAAIGDLMRRAYSQSKCLNAWSVCRFDIWAQRRIADLEAFHDSGWQEHMRLLWSADGSLASAAFAFDRHHGRDNPHPFCLILSSSSVALAEELLDWVETQDSAPEIEAVENNFLLTGLLQARGYTRLSDFMVIREKPLVGTAVEPVNLPPGYWIKALNREGWPAFFTAVHAVFNMLDTPEAFGSIQRAPSAMPGMDLTVINDRGEIAAFCSVWMDQRNHVAEFEPVGTVPGFRKQGLASALITDVSNRLRELGCPLVKVESWSETPAANQLYASCGLVETGRIFSWKKDGS